MFSVIVNFAQTEFIYEKTAVHNFVMSVFLSVVSVLISFFLITNMKLETKYVGMVFGQLLPYSVAAIFVWIYIFFQKPTLIKNICYIWINIWNSNCISFAIS